MARAVPTANDFAPLPIKDDDGLPIVYELEIVNEKTEKAPKGKFNPDGSKQWTIVEFNVLNDGFTDRKVWDRPTFGLSKKGAKRLTKLTQLVIAADPNFEIGEEYETHDLIGKFVRATLINNEREGTVYQKPGEYFKPSTTKAKVTKKAKTTEAVEAGIEY